MAAGAGGGAPGGQGELDLEALHGLDDAAALDRLRAIPGVGRWTAEYVLLRGLGRLDNFPGDDVGGQARLHDMLHLAARPDYDEVQHLLNRWRPYRGLMYFFLLLARKEREGVVQGIPE